jgi:hypothetical protein
VSTPPLFPSCSFTEFPTGLRLRFYSIAFPFAPYAGDFGISPGSISEISQMTTR